MPFKKDLLNSYNHFMTYTIKNKIFNILLTIIENIPILIAIDFMWMDDFLSTIFTPFYYLAPHIYLDRFNAFFSNQCSLILIKNNSNLASNSSSIAISNTDNSTASTNLSNRITPYIPQNISNKISRGFLRFLQNTTSDFNISSINNSSNLNTTTSLTDMLTNTTSSILNNITNINNTTAFNNLTSANSTMNSSISGDDSVPTDPIIYPIKFFSKVLMEFDNTFCIYNPTVLIMFYLFVTWIFILFFLLGKFNPRNTKKSCIKYSIVFLMVNFINILVRPLGYLFFIVFLNRPIILLYQNNFIDTDYFSDVVIYTVISVVFFCLFLVFCILFNKYMNNAFFFEEFPHDFFSNSDTTNLQVLKILVGFKFNFDKLSGFRYITFINYSLGLFIFIRMCIAVVDRNLIINNYLLKIMRNFFAFFFCIYLFLKLLNNSINGLRNPNEFGIVIEMIIIGSILFIVICRLLSLDDDFTFKDREEIINEILRFFYLMDEKLINKSINKSESSYTGNSKKKKIQLSGEYDEIIDDILIGHKMKCTEEECHMCEQQITTPDAKTLFKIIYHQFLGFEKELKEENEELCLIIKILLLKIIDEDKIHRISYLILKNTKVSLSTYLKINYIYEMLLEEMNQDLKNLLTIKYGEVYDDLLFIINYFEEIFGFVKSRTEKVELVINTTNNIGQVYQKIIDNLYFLKRNKRIYFDSYNMLQIICLLRLIFQKNIDNELTENLEYNFHDFLENVDRVFEENLSFIARYDFYDLTWRIKKVPKTFIDLTRTRVDDLIDQSLEKIFPNFMAKSIIKELEELIMANKYDNKLNFKTFVLDSESNVRYVKFEIEIIPNLHGNYLLYLHCHFQQKQVMIIDEAGNFVNGCEELYKKIGIKSEVISMSRGKINMYNFFNVDKNVKLEDIKIVSINIDNLIDIIKKVYLIDNENINFETIPPFLYELFIPSWNSSGTANGSMIINNTQNPAGTAIMGSNINITNSNVQSNVINIPGAEFTYNASNVSKNSAGGNNMNYNGSQITISGNNNLEYLRNNQNNTNILINNNMRKFRDNNLIYLNVYQTINLNNKKYIVYSIKIKTDEPQKKEFKYDDEDFNPNKQFLHSQNLNALNKTNIKDSNISAMNDRNYNKSNLSESDLKTPEKLQNLNNINQNLNLNEIKNNYGEYYNYFYETNKSASLEYDYNKYNPNSGLSHGNSSTSDVYSFLLLKNAPKNANRTDYFKSFLRFIYILNLFLVAVGLFSIIYSNTYTKNTMNFIETLQIFNTLRTNIISATANILSMCKFTNDEITYLINSKNSNIKNISSLNNIEDFYETFDDFFKNEFNPIDLYSKTNNFSYDTLIKSFNSYYGEMILDSYKNFEKGCYNLFGPIDFDLYINFYTNILIFNSIGNSVLTKHKISDTLDYFPITLNTIDKRSDEKIYINIYYLTFENDFISQSSKLENTNILNNLSLFERNNFNQNYNLYKFFINYFSVYVKNFQDISTYFFNFGFEYTGKLQFTAKILLIIITVMHVIFVLVSLLSIFIYKKILLKEFNSLYSISEESLTKLKDKFKLVEEIIKSEKYPSKVYFELRNMRENENSEKNNKNKKSDQINSKSDLIANGKKNLIGNKNSKIIINHSSNIMNNTKNNTNITNNNSNNNNKHSGIKDESLALIKAKSKFLTTNEGKKEMTNSRFEKKTTVLSQTLNDSNEAALQNYYSFNYSGATKGLQKSMSIKNKEKMEEIKRQHSKAQASIMLLSRLNFEFEFINNYIKFIVFMSIFYIALGILVLLILEQKYNTLNKSLIFMDTFINENVNIYNVLIGVKLAIILNRKWPNTIKPEKMGIYSTYSFQELLDLKKNQDIESLNTYGFYTEEGIINKFYNSTNIIFEMETQNSFFDQISSFQSGFNGDDTCDLIYSFDNDMLNKIKNDNPKVKNNLISLCKKLPIMHSNLNSIFTNVVRELREVLNEFKYSDEVDISLRVKLLQNKFRNVDTIFFIFIEPYFKYIRDYLLQVELNTIVIDYFNFLIIIFSLNIIIDFLMLIFIWFKNYKQVIKYVNNIQLVADSITN